MWLLEEDMKNISSYLKMDRAAFMDKYVRYIPEAERYSLKEVVDEDWRCILLKDMKYCSVYPARPTQCRCVNLKVTYRELLTFAKNLSLLASGYDKQRAVGSRGRVL